MHQVLSERSRTVRTHNRTLSCYRCDDAYLAVRVQGNSDSNEQVKTDSYITLSRSGPKQQDLDPSVVQDEINVLKVQLRQAEETAQKVQKEVPSESSLSICF